MTFLKYLQEVPKRTEHENQPIFSTEFENIVHTLADFEKRNTGGHRNFHFDRYRMDIFT